MSPRADSTGRPPVNGAAGTAPNRPESSQGDSKDLKLRQLSAFASAGVNPGDLFPQPNRFREDEMERLQRSGSRLLPILHRVSAIGWPGLSERARREATDALADLESLLGRRVLTFRVPASSSAAPSAASTASPGPAQTEAPRPPSQEGA